MLDKVLKFFRQLVEVLKVTFFYAILEIFNEFGYLAEVMRIY